MEDYPTVCVDHNLPLVVLFGLPPDDAADRVKSVPHVASLLDRGAYISSDLPNIPGPTATELLDSFQELDARQSSWNARPGRGKMGTMGFTFRSVGRAFTLPCRKALPPSSSEVLESSVDPRRPSTAPTVHSPLSPLTAGSPVYPDGILPITWFAKHQLLLPSAVIAFFTFHAGQTSGGDPDLKLRNEINGLRASIVSSGYKLRLAVVLVAEGDLTGVANAERVAHIRRSTSLEPRSVFLLPAGLSSVELGAFVGTILASLQPSCLEYYRELSKHARRKKNRSSIPSPIVPPTSGTSRTLSLQGWNVRYETKLGCFAEFRQEMDAAGQSYEAAYELLVDSDPIEGIPNWSPRFDQARLLADSLAIRILRCLLWTGQTTSAVQSWANHRLRMQDLVERQGKGIDTYGWAAWEARWSAVMAELIERADVPIFQVIEHGELDEGPQEIPDIYAIPEKAFASEERLPPWDLLHHEGYWLQRAAKHTRRRRKLAMGIPKEDRNAPGQSPASSIASRTHLYDTYLCPEPHLEYGLADRDSFDHSALLIRTHTNSRQHFAQRHQHHIVERIQLETAREYMRLTEWETAMDIIQPLWQQLSWRRSAWWRLVEEVSWAVRACSRNLGDGEILVAVEWELLCRCLTPVPGWTYDFLACLDGLDIEEKPHAVLDADTLAPCFAAYFTFGSTVGNVGVPLPLQLSIISQAQTSSAPIHFDHFQVFFEGGLRGIEVQHSVDEHAAARTADGSLRFHQLDLHEPGDEPTSPRDRPLSQMPALVAQSDLTFAAGQTKTFEFEMRPREAGEVRATLLSLAVRVEAFDADITIPIRPEEHDAQWMTAAADTERQREKAEGPKISSDINIASEQTDQASPASQGSQTSSAPQLRKLDFGQRTAIEILPKPPRLQIELPGLRSTLYTDESTTIHIHLSNEEEDVIDSRVTIHLLGNLDQSPHLTWMGDNGHVVDAADQVAGTATATATATGTAALPDRQIDGLEPNQSKELTLQLQALPQMADYVLEVRADYSLRAEPDTVVSKTAQTNLTFVNPFEANYDFLPRVHAHPWPSYFTIITPNSSDTTAADPTRTSTPHNREHAQGLSHRLIVAARVTSFAVEPLIVQTTTLQLLDRNGDEGWQCDLAQPDGLEAMNHTIAPGQSFEQRFELQVHTPRLEDPPTALIGSRLHVCWSRENNSDAQTTSVLLVPPVSIPFDEPRIVASVQPSTLHRSIIALSYMLENPSMHITNFNVAMEASDDFAFSGPKATSVQLLPLSRRALHFNLIPNRQGVWIRPVLKVMDLGVGRMLKVLAAEGCKADKKGLLIWTETE